MKPSTYLLPAIAAVVNAQSDSGCSASNGPLQIQNQGDATAIGGCTSFTGSITIATNTQDKINLPNIRSISGDLIADGATNMTSFGADSLQTIGGKFTLNNLQLLTSISFPFLTSVGDLSFQGLPNLAALGFSANVKTIKSLNIQNTFLGSLAGLNPQTIDSITVANNRMLQTLSFQVSQVMQSINIQGNGDNFNAQFPNLQTAQNITFRQCPTINIPSLMNVTGSLGFYDNSLTSISAVNLTSVGQTLAINSHPNLNNVSLPALTSIGGGFQVQNNTALTSVDVPQLKTIGGALDFYGGFTSVTLAGLKDCRGGFNLQSSSNSLSCSTFDGEHGSSSVIKGTYKCQAGVSNPGNITSTGGGSTTKKGSAIAVNIPSHGLLVGLLMLVAGFMGTM